MLTTTITILQGPSFQIFINSLKSQKTKDKYSKIISNFAKYKNVNQLDDLLIGDPKSHKAAIMGYLLKLKEEGLSSSSRVGALAAIKHFYEMNDTTLAWKPISKFIGERELENEDRPYTREEIQKLLGIADLKYRAMIHLMLSSGVRIGAIPSIKRGHLEKMPSHNIYKISIYKKSKATYHTFCTPECYQVLNEYLEQRRRQGEVITDKSPLFRTDPNPSDMNDIKNPSTLTYAAIKTRIYNMSLRCGLMIKQKTGDTNKLGKRRNDVQMAHGLRKFFATQMENADVNDLDNEALLGHKTGLRGTYRKTPEKRLLEYLKAVNNLTINEENRLKLKVKSLESQEGRIITLEKELKELTDSHDILVQMYEADPQERRKLKQLYREAQKSGTRIPGQMLFLKKEEYTPGSFSHSSYEDNIRDQEEKIRERNKK